MSWSTSHMSVLSLLFELFICHLSDLEGFGRFAATMPRRWTMDLMSFSNSQDLESHLRFDSGHRRCLAICGIVGRSIGRGLEPDG